MFFCMTPDDILQGLNAEQRAVATTFGKPVVVVAGAGTGKTRSITHRIAYGVATDQLQAAATLAVTFTQRAAGELRQRLAGLGVPTVQARTFHSAALRQLRFFWPQAYGSELPEILGRNIGLVAAAAKQQGLSDEPAQLRDLASEISWAKVSNVMADDYPRQAATAGRSVAGIDAEQVSAVLTSYEQLKRRREVIDFDDILLCTVALLHEFPQIAQRVRETYRYFTVDEFQDVNPLQWSLLQLWLADSVELCVVGDPKQNIHSFAGADPRFMQEMVNDPSYEVLQLTANYRSTPQILAAANAVGQSAADSKAQVSRSHALRATRPDGPRVLVAGSSNEHWESRDVAAWLRRLHDEDGVPWQQMAVLYRVHARSAAYEAALAELGIPYQVRDAEGFYERPEIRRALAQFHHVAIQQPGAPPLPLLTEVVAALGWSPQAPDAIGQQRQLWESLNVLLELATDIVGQGSTSAAELNVALAQRVNQQHMPTGNGVTLASMHSAKGLEWDAVAVTGVQEGNLPFVLATRDEQIEEERRLCYVALTRARKWLRVSWDSGRSGQDQRSRFLTPLVADELRLAVELQRGAATSDEASDRFRRSKKQRAVGRCFVCAKPLQDAAERKLGHHQDCPAELDEELFARLRHWRLDRAEQDSVPAFVVFTDATLQAIAERKPTTPHELIMVPGVGQTKLDRYATDVLAIVQETAQSGGDA